MRGQFTDRMRALDREPDLRIFHDMVLTFGVVPLTVLSEVLDDYLRTLEEGGDADVEREKGSMVLSLGIGKAKKMKRLSREPAEDDPLGVVALQGDAVEGQEDQQGWVGSVAFMTGLLSVASVAAVVASRRWGR